MAMATSAIEMRSPAVSSMSSSRAGGSGETCWARSRRSSVVSPIADTTTTTWLPAWAVSTMRRATRLMLSASATEDPPYFCTTKPTVTSGTTRTTASSSLTSGPWRPDGARIARRRLAPERHRPSQRRERQHEHQRSQHHGVGGDPPVPTGFAGVAGTGTGTSRRPVHAAASRRGRPAGRPASPARGATTPRGHGGSSSQSASTDHGSPGAAPSRSTARSGRRPGSTAGPRRRSPVMTRYSVAAPRSAAHLGLVGARRPPRAARRRRARCSGS